MVGNSGRTGGAAPRRNHLDLARRILDIARHDGLAEGAHLPEQMLADRCNVSRTPVRSALKLLQDQGLVTWAAAGGFRLAPGFRSGDLPLPETADAALAQRLLTDRAARRLDRSVTAGELIRRYGLARGPVQRALQHLADEGLMSRAPGQAWLFAPLPDEPESQGESLDFRLLLEPEAITAPGFRLDADRAADLRRAMGGFLALPDERLDAGEFRRLDGEFHELIARGAGNRYLSEALLQHLKLRDLPGAILRANVVRLRQAMAEHLGILDHLESGRLAVAADLLRVHLRLSRSQRPQAANRGAPPLLGRVGGTGR
jgi:DNA-binding GntR family transcriptional regulator